MTIDNGHLYVVLQKNSTKSKVCSAESGNDDYGRYQHLICILILKIFCMSFHLNTLWNKSLKRFQHGGKIMADYG